MYKPPANRAGEWRQYLNQWGWFLYGSIRTHRQAQNIVNEYNAGRHPGWKAVMVRVT